jgi:hypothetical protein
MIVGLEEISFRELYNYFAAFMRQGIAHISGVGEIVMLYAGWQHCVRGVAGVGAFLCGINCFTGRKVD